MLKLPLGQIHVTQVTQEVNADVHIISFGGALEEFSKHGGGAQGNRLGVPYMARIL